MDPATPLSAAPSAPAAAAEDKKGKGKAPAAASAEGGVSAADSLKASTLFPPVLHSALTARNEVSRWPQLLSVGLCVCLPAGEAASGVGCVEGGRGSDRGRRGEQRREQQQRRQPRRWRFICARAAVRRTAANAQQEGPSLRVAGAPLPLSLSLPQCHRTFPMNQTVAPSTSHFLSQPSDASYSFLSHPYLNLFPSPSPAPASHPIHPQRDEALEALDDRSGAGAAAARVAALASVDGDDELGYDDEYDDSFDELGALGAEDF